MMRYDACPTSSGIARDGKKSTLRQYFMTHVVPPLHAHPVHYSLTIKPDDLSTSHITRMRLHGDIGLLFVRSTGIWVQPMKCSRARHISN